MKTVLNAVPLKKRLVSALKSSTFGQVKGARIKIVETDDGYLRGLVTSPAFSGMDVPARHVAIRNSLKGKIAKNDRKRILAILTAAPTDVSDD